MTQIQMIQAVQINKLLMTIKFLISLPVTDTGQDIEKVVTGVVGDLLDNFLAEVEEDGEDSQDTR